MSRPLKELTNTSYALLGLLAIKPWTTYELAQQMDRSLNRFWPRAQSKVYEEPRKLVARGLARAQKSKVGRRPRTVYTITPNGRAELARWLTTPGSGPVLEFEQLMKIFFAEHGTKADLLANLGAARRWAETDTAEHAVVGRTYLEGKGAFPERAAITFLTGRFLSDFARMVGEWATWAEAVASKWPDDLSKATPDRDALRAIVERDERSARKALSRRSVGSGQRRESERSSRAHHVS